MKIFEIFKNLSHLVKRQKLTPTGEFGERGCVREPRNWNEYLQKPFFRNFCQIDNKDFYVSPTKVFKIQIMHHENFNLSPFKRKNGMVKNSHWKAILSHQKLISKLWKIGAISKLATHQKSALLSAHRPHSPHPSDMYIPYPNDLWP